MKLQKCKLIAVLMSVVIFISIFLIGDNNSYDNGIDLSNYPLIGNLIEEELLNPGDNLELYKWNKNFLFYLDTDLILFYVLINCDIYKLSQKFHRKILKFYYFSAFIVFFLNKRDGKKKKCVYSLSSKF